jgi:serine acetyltransferase
LLLWWLHRTTAAVAAARGSWLRLLLMLLLLHQWLQEVWLLQAHRKRLLQLLQQLLDVCTTCSISQARHGC